MNFFSHATGEVQYCADFGPNGDRLPGMIAVGACREARDIGGRYLFASLPRFLT